MDIETIAKEAKVLYEAMPMLKTTKIDDPSPFLNCLYTDLSKISLICSNADGTFDWRESRATTLIIYGICIMMKGDSVDTAVSSIQCWDNMPALDKQTIEEAVKKLLKETTSSDRAEILSLPSIIRRVDKEYGSNMFDLAAHAMYRFAEIIVKADGTVSWSEKDALLKVRKMIYSEDEDDSEDETEFEETSAKLVMSAQPSDETLEGVMEDLNSLIGLNSIKDGIQTLANFLKIQKLRMERGMEKTPFSLHAVFSGPPGTGKTTVARLLGRIFTALGFLPNGHLVETDRAGLVAGFIGQTSGKVDEVVNKAIGGVLFIDEAYALLPESPNDYGHEAINIILKRMEDNRDELVVVVAGYTDEMESFIESNPGLKSRFNRYFYFDHFPPDKLLEIFEKFAREANYNLTKNAKVKLLGIIKEKYECRDRTFGNARFARNMFENAIANQANRISGISPITDKILTTITLEDIS